MTHIGGWRGVIVLLIASGVVAIPMGLSVGDIAHTSQWWPGAGLQELHILSVISIWLLVLGWVLMPDMRRERR